MRGRRFHRNPYRRVAGVETKTWLPDDAGTFTDPDAEVGFAFKDDRRINILPDGRRVGCDFIGSGEWTTAWMGDDGWVYLFTTDVERSKELLVRLTAEMSDEPSAVHFPWVERIGMQGRDVVYRSPFYERKLSDDNVDIVLGLQGLHMRLMKTVPPDRLFWEIATGAGDALPGAPLVAEALLLMAYGAEQEGWDTQAAFEFPWRNLAQDADGNLVLLDVILHGH